MMKYNVVSITEGILNMNNIEFGTYIIADESTISRYKSGSRRVPARVRKLCEKVIEEFITGWKGGVV